MMKILNNAVAILLHEIGFDSIREILYSTVALKHNLSTVYVVSIPIGIALNGVLNFTESYIFSPALGVAIFWVISIIDTFLGMGIAISDQDKQLEASKISRSIVRAFMQTLIVAVVFKMSQVYTFAIFPWMVSSLLLMFTLTVLYSVLDNCHKLGLLSDQQFDLIKKIVNIKTLLNKFKSNEKDK